MLINNMLKVVRTKRVTNPFTRARQIKGLARLKDPSIREETRSDNDHPKIESTRQLSDS